MSDLAVEPKPKTKAKISEAETHRRRQAVRFAKTHNRLEGLYPSAEGSAIFDAYVRGDIEKDEILPRLHALHHQL